MTAAALVVCAAAVLAATGLYALRSRSVVGTLVTLQCGYLLLSFVVRPAILLAVQPTPRAGDSVADPRMAALGYEDVLAVVLGVVLVGLLVFAGASVVVVRAQRERGRWADCVGPGAAATLLVTGWCCRLAADVSGSSVVATFGALASVGVGALVLAGSRMRPARRNVTVLLLLASELAWCFLNSSKAPIFALGLWVFVVLLGSRRSGRRAVLGAVAAATALVAIFPLVQEAKVSESVLADVQSASHAYPAPLRGSILIVQRFDLVAATTDAVLAGPGSWISGQDALGRGASALVPAQLQADKADNAGALWAVEVRSKTRPNSNTGVHLAEGPIAEGYLLGGLPGVVAEVLFMVAVTAGVALLLTSRSRFGVLLAIVMLSQPFLFERGFLGIMEGLGKSLQVAAAAYVIVILQGALAGRNASRVRAAHRASPAPGPVVAPLARDLVHS